MSQNELITVTWPKYRNILMLRKRLNIIIVFCEEDRFLKNDGGWGGHSLFVHSLPLNPYMVLRSLEPIRAHCGQRPTVNISNENVEAS